MNRLINQSALTQPANRISQFANDSVMRNNSDLSPENAVRFDAFCTELNTERFIYARQELLDGEDSRIASIDSPKHGSAFLTGEGDIMYVPDEDFFGGDYFQYEIETGQDCRAKRAIHIFVGKLP